MSDVTERIVDLKTQAKNRRDLKRWDRAAALLKQAIGVAEKEYNSTSAPEWRAMMASELADCWGILGGVERRWALDPASDARGSASSIYSVRSWRMTKVTSMKGSPR